MTITDLDTLRADAMRAMLDDEGRRHVWKYDVTPIDTAYRLALDDQDYDNIQIAGDARKAGHRYALTGPGICDSPFTTPAELLMLIYWLCADGGYLSSYTRQPWQWQPHLAADQTAIAALWAAA